MSVFISSFEEAKRSTDSDVAAAILVLADEISDLRLALKSGDVSQALGHSIALGVRHGLFGAGADANACADLLRYSSVEVELRDKG
ncbi:MAG: hypothetical protein ACIARR_00435 [Phycisphaerales bacterium JB059]